MSSAPDGQPWDVVLDVAGGRWLSRPKRGSGASRNPREWVPEQIRFFKQEQLDAVRVNLEGTDLTTQQGVRIDHTDDALTVGERGPTLLEDLQGREKVTHFGS